MKKRPNGKKPLGRFFYRIGGFIFSFVLSLIFHSNRLEANQEIVLFTEKLFQLLLKNAGEAAAVYIAFVLSMSQVCSV